MPLPSGTITFLFTDIEGSTNLWKQYPDAMPTCLVEHEILLRRAIEANNGAVFKTVGDGLCAAFATPREALKAALSAQTALCAHAWGETGALRVRMGLHTGTAQERDNDYFGPNLSRVARLVALACGGQILLSQATYELVRDGLPDGMNLMFLGTHRLKDLQHPEHVYQLLHPDLPSDFPPLQSLDALPNNLPQQMTSFIGREQQLREVEELLGKTRLLTLTGSGGTGKTRFSLQVGAEVLEHYADGVWLVELASLSDPLLVPQAVAAVLNVCEEAGRSLLATLTATLKSKTLLLILDNCEHLIHACAQFADTLLKQCPHLRILASSREGLGITGEVTYYVPSLTRLDPRQLPSGQNRVSALTECESVQLFIERATALQSHFTITEANAPAVAEICYRLDGIPLAIELAAARIKVLSVEQIASRLEDCFRLLTGGSRTALPRQQTLRALIDWSYDLLNDQEKALLGRLSVFAGGWTLEACEQVATGEDMEAWDTLDLLSALVDKSLVVCEESRGESRYRLLETIRQYASEKLLASGQSNFARKRHRDYYLALAEDARPKLRGASQTAALSQLEAEMDNLRAALNFCCEEAESAEIGLRFAGALWRLFLIRGYRGEIRAVLNALLNRPDAQFPTLARADALTGAGNLAHLQGEMEQARLFHEECLEIQRALGDKQGIAVALCNLGLLAQEQGDPGRAHSLQEESLALHREMGDKQGIARALGHLGLLAQDVNNHELARALHEESLALRRELEDSHGIAITLGNLGLTALQQSDGDSAYVCLVECLTLCRSLEEKFVTPYALEGFAGLAKMRQQPERATQLYGAATALREALGAPLPARDGEEIARTLIELRQMLGEETFEQVYATGRSLTLQQAIEYAICPEEA